MVLGYKFLSVLIAGLSYNIYNVFLIANNNFIHREWSSRNSTLELMVMMVLVIVLRWYNEKSVGNIAIF